MNGGTWLRASRSEHHLPVVDVQAARIDSLLEEMRPARDPLRVDVSSSHSRVDVPSRTFGSQHVAPPEYHQLYSSPFATARPSRKAPPNYRDLQSSRPYVSSWMVTGSESRTQQAGWLRHPRPLTKSSLSPAAYFRELEQKNLASPSSPRGPIISKLDEPDNTVSDTASSSSGENRGKTPISEGGLGVEGNGSTMSRNTPRQASFIAAVARCPLRDVSASHSQLISSSSDSQPKLKSLTSPLRLETFTRADMTPLRRPRRPASPYRRQNARSTNDVNEFANIKLRSVSRSTAGAPRSGDESCSRARSRSNAADPPLDSNHNEALKMRRPRPKSYVLATSASLPEEPSVDSSRELSSLGSTSSVEQHTSRSLNAPHPPATHRLHKFIALFNHSKSQSVEGTSQQPKQRMKRSRTSLPTNRVPMPPTTLRRDAIERQSWVKHQELALGKSGKRQKWDDRWAILAERSLFLCVQPPSFSNEKVVELCGMFSRVDVHSSIVDIAYDWLSAAANAAKQRHVVRIVTQTRHEHLIELATESEMLSWITVLQASSEGVVASVSSVDVGQTSPTSSRGQLHNSYSIASLASSSCSTTTSERNGGVSRDNDANPTNQLIMHRYKAKSSQLQSPIASKRMEAAQCSSSTAMTGQAGTSSGKDGHENGEATTPKSGRKWKKSKAGKQGSGGSSGAASHSSLHTSHATTSAAATAPTPVLGLRLADCHVAKPGDHVPLLVRICVAVVESHGADTVGIYRIPGNTAAVNALKESLSNGGFDSVDLDQVESLDTRWRDVNVVSSLLKMFLRKLPEPLLTDKLYPFFIDANRIASHHNRLHKLRNLLRKLPRHHYETLRFLILHLAEITKNSDINKMESRNLALMFGPSIVRPSDDNMATMVTHMSDQCKIIETLIHYHLWMFDENSTTEDPVPEQHPSESVPQTSEPGSYGIGVPTGVSAASFNDMHNLIRKANEDQAAALMSEGKAGKIKNILRRNSRRDKSKSKLKIESTAAAAVNPRPMYSQPTPSTTSVESAFCGNYQERDIDAEIESRQTISPQCASGSADGVDLSPSLESSLGSLPDTARTEPGIVEDDAARKKRQQDMYSARRIFIAGGAVPNDDATTSAAVDALANHSHHLNIANSPAFEVLSEETREKIRRMQRKQHWHEVPKTDLLKTSSPTKDVTDALSCTSDYSTTSSAPLSSANPPLAVACLDQPNSSSDYASSDPSPCARNASASPAIRPAVLGISATTETCTLAKSQKIRLRTRAGNRDAARRHTLTDVDTLKVRRMMKECAARRDSQLKEGRLDKLARWFGLRKSSPDVSAEEQQKANRRSVCSPLPDVPPVIVRTSPNELTPVSGDEQL